MVRRCPQSQPHSDSGNVARRSLVLRTVLAVVSLIVCWSIAGLAVDDAKAVLLASTNPNFVIEGTRSRKWITGVSPIEGTINITSDAELVFDGGPRWSVRIPYANITHLTYGREVGRRVKGLVIVFPWAGSSQFTDKPHYILTVIRQAESGAEQCEAFELGRNLVRPILDMLERRTEKRVEFLSADACLVMKTAKECRLGNPDELRGLTRVHVDTRGAAEYRANIVSELENAGLGLQVVAQPEDAEIFLRFHGQRFFEDKTIDGGRGEVTVVRDHDSVVVLQFTDRDTSVWGRAPSINFGREFVKAYKKANAR